MNGAPMTRGPGRGRQSGTIVPLVIFAMVALMGCIAACIDVGMLASEKARLQSGCDAAALAGAGNLTTQATAQNAAALWYQSNFSTSTTQPSGTGTNPQNYTIGADTVAVTTPYGDSYTTGQGWLSHDLVQVSATRRVVLDFAPVIGIPHVDVTARAVAYAINNGGASIVQPGDGCIFAKDQGFNLTCNNITIKGSVYSNAGISITANNTSVTKTMHAETSVSLTGNNVYGNFALEYGTTYSVPKGSQIASYTKVAQVDATPPLNYTPANYATDFKIDYTHSSAWNITGNSFTATPGTYYVNGDMTINANNANLSGCTFIVNGNFTCNTNNVTMTGCSTALSNGAPNYMCVYLLGGGTIGINQNNITVHGDLYAPNGYITCVSNNIQQGWWIARRISVTVNNWELDGIANRQCIGILKLVE